MIGLRHAARHVSFNCGSVPAGLGLNDLRRFFRHAR
jgi:hypothetical protein